MGVVSWDMGEGEGQRGRIIRFRAWASSRQTDTAQSSRVRTQMTKVRNMHFRSNVFFCQTRFKVHRSLLLSYKDN